MNLDVARGSSAAFAPSIVRCLWLVPDPVAASSSPTRGFCSWDALSRCGSWLDCRVNQKWKQFSSVGGLTGFRTEKRRRIEQALRADFCVLMPAAAGLIVCQFRRSGENTGRFEDGDMGSFADHSLNGKVEKKRSGNGSGWMGVDSDVRDSLPSKHWNGTGDALRSGFFHDNADCVKERGWSASSSWAKESFPSSWSAANLIPAGDGRKVNRSGFNPTDELLLKHKASTAGLPMSLRMLKRKQVQNRALKKGLLQEATDNALQSYGFLAMAGQSTCCSLKKAFSSMVFMIRTLQSLTVHLRKGVFYDDFQEVLAVMHRELHSSFLWLFQQVFACTPRLMLAVMLLLANYTVFSMGNHVALSAVSTPPTWESTPSEIRLVGGLPLEARSECRTLRESSSGVVALPLDARNHGNCDSWLSVQTEFSGAGGSSGPTVAISGSPDRARRESERYASHKGAIFDLQQDINQSSEEAHAQGGSNSNDFVELKLKQLSLSEPLFLNHELKKSMVAPVRTKLAPDNYSCYDRTELIYQYAICSDSTNALLLANYAQFLFLVRHDHDRAEQLFYRAVKADPTDCDAISHFASFLWLARGDRVGAEKAFRQVVDMDPSNPYFTGCLANFMWHSGERTSCNITAQTDRMQGVTDIDLS